MAKKIPQPPKHLPGRVYYAETLKYFTRIAQAFPIGTIKEKSGIRLEPVALIINSDGAIESFRIVATIHIHFREGTASDAREFLEGIAKVFTEDEFFSEYKLVENLTTLDEPTSEAEGEESLSIRVTAARTNKIRENS